MRFKVFLQRNFEKRLPKTISVKAQVILEEECARSGEFDVLLGKLSL